VTRRNSFYLGGFCLVALGLFLIWLWQPGTQIRKHSEHLLASIENKDWPKFATSVADNYQDQWGNDRATVFERTREICHYARGLRLVAVAPTLDVAGGSGHWRARVLIEGAANDEVVGALKAHVNTLTTPFELEWRRMSAKPWDWKLVGVRNRQLTLPSQY
jgi:hypothetical protein